VNNVEVVAKGKILVNDFNAKCSRITRACDRYFISFKNEFASFGRVDTCNTFDESALACTVISNQCGDFSGTGPKDLLTFLRERIGEAM
jgi:hypothetical protein